MLKFAQKLAVDDSKSEPNANAKPCDRCNAAMEHIEAGYFSCPLCHYQIVEPKSGFWVTGIEEMGMREASRHLHDVGNIQPCPGPGQTENTLHDVAGRKFSQANPTQD